MNFFGKSYNEIEAELNKTNNRIQLLQEKIESLIQKDIEKSKILYETNNRIQLLEEKLQKKTSLISLSGSFIDINNCNNITISYNTPYDTAEGFILLIDNVQLQSKTYTFNTIYKVINELRNIQNIIFEWRFPIPDNFNQTEIPHYFRGHFDIIKKIIEINSSVKLIIYISSNFRFEWFNYIFNDLDIDNILGIEITYTYQYKSEQITEIIKGLNKKLNKKIIFKN
jgi:hypothetical protein